MEEKGGSTAKEEEELLWISGSSKYNNKEELQARPGRRDEWSDGAVAALLDAYEAKWALRNRAKLKGHDWEDVARAVSCRAGESCRAQKTATQCKNKVESMKKRYRSETAAAAAAAREVSKWPLFDRLDGLVRCRGVGAAAEKAVVIVGVKSEGQHEPPAAAPPTGGTGMSPPKANGDAVIVEGECGDTPAKENQNETNKNEVQGISAQSNDGSREERETARKNKNKKRKRKRKEQDDVTSEVIRSVQYLAEVVLKVEQARMEAMREVETIRAEAEAKRGEMDLKRTEIIANTQLQIARLFAKNCGNI